MNEPREALMPGARVEVAKIAPADALPDVNNATIDRAVAVLETSELLGIQLSLADAAVHYGMQEPTRSQRFSETIKRHVPEKLKDSGRFLTISEKIGRIALAMDGQNDSAPSASERLEQDREFWTAMNVNDAWHMYQFNQAHFSRTSLDLSARTIPVELQWLQARDPDTFTDLQHLQKTERLHLRKLTKTPDAVLDSANKVAEDTQKTFMHTWLPQFLHEGTEPIMTDEEQHAHNYRGELSTIEMFRQRALGIETSGKLGKTEQATLDRANQLLAEGLAGEYVLQRLLHDHAARESESLRKVLPLLALITGAAWGVQTYAPNDAIRALAKVAGSGDDVAAEVMSLPRLKLSKEKLRNRLAWFVPVAVGMIAADSFVDTVDKSVNARLGGAMYGATTVGLSFASSIGSLVEHTARYRELVAEGKVRDEHLAKPGRIAREHYIYNDPIRRGIVAGVLAGPAICAALWPWIEDKPYIYVPLGAIEPICATISAKYDEKRLPRRLEQYTRKLTKRIQASTYITEQAGRSPTVP